MYILNYFIEILRNSLKVSLLIFIVFLIICLAYYLNFNIKNILAYLKFTKTSYKVIRGTLHFEKIAGIFTEKLKEVYNLDDKIYKLYVSFVYDGEKFNVPLSQPIGEIDDKPFCGLIRKVSGEYKIRGKIVNIYINKNKDVFCPTVFWMSISNSFLDYITTAFVIASIVGILLFLASFILLLTIFI